jgi:hypothetical protein
MTDAAVDPDWTSISRRAALASHRLIGWIYWDPVAIDAYTSLGVENGLGYYIASRGATLGDGGNAAVSAAFYSIHPGFIAMSLDLCRAATTFEDAAEARNHGVVVGLEAYVPEIRDGLAELHEPLWAAADSLHDGGRVFFASLRAWPRPDDPVLSAWLAVNCIREWRGDTHWALLVANDIGPIEAGVLDAAWRSHGDDWLPKSRGADDDSIAAAMLSLEGSGLASGGAVNSAGLRLRQQLEDQLDELCTKAWRQLGLQQTTAFLELVEPVGQRLVERIDATAGARWMPAGRDRPDLEIADA